MADIQRSNVACDQIRCPALNGSLLIDTHGQGIGMTCADATVHVGNVRHNFMVWRVLRSGNTVRWRSWGGCTAIGQAGLTDAGKRTKNGDGLAGDYRRWVINRGVGCIICLAFVFYLLVKLFGILNDCTGTGFYSLQIFFGEGATDAERYQQAGNRNNNKKCQLPVGLHPVKAP